jgi:general secretion pathway protein L
VAFRRLLAELPTAAGNVWLVLPRESVLVREVHMPLAAEEALREAVGFDLDRLTPMPAEQAWFDYQVTGRNVATQRLMLRLAVTPRAPVEARLAELREMGAAVLGVGLMDDVAASTSPMNLLPQEQRDRPATSQAAIVARVLAAIAAALAVAALVYPLWLKREAVIALHPRLEKAKAEAEISERLGKEIEKLASEHNFVLGKKHAQIPVVTLMDDLSRLLPDTTWVQQLDVKTGPKSRELQLAGESGSSSQLIEVLEQSGIFANASFKSPLTKGATPGTERFLLAADVKPKPLPDPLPEAALLARPDTVTPSLPPPQPAAPSTVVPPPASAPGVTVPSPQGATPATAPGATSPAPGAPAQRPAPAGDPARKG